MKPVPPVPRLGGPACAALFAAAFAVRVAATLVSGNFGDARAYQLAARTLWQTGAVSAPATDALFFRPPAYPAFLAAVTLGHPERVQAARVANAALGALAALLARRAVGPDLREPPARPRDRKLAAVHPAFVLAASRLQTEPLYLVLLLARGAPAARGVRPALLESRAPLGRPPRARGVDALRRPRVRPFLLAPLRDGRYPFRARWHLAMSALLGFGLALAPWTARNALVFHEFLLVNDAAGYAFYGGNSDASARPDRRAEPRRALEGRRCPRARARRDDRGPARSGPPLSDTPVARHDRVGARGASGEPARHRPPARREGPGTGSAPFPTRASGRGASSGRSASSPSRCSPLRRSASPSRRAGASSSSASPSWPSRCRSTSPWR